MVNDTVLAREKLRPYVEIAAISEYLKDQILKWETWYLAHTEEINDFEGLRDNLHRELTELQGREFRHSVHIHAMRHSNIALTMGTYTDARLLDTAQAVEAYRLFRLRI
jgi:hypothetical protein